MLDHRTMRGPTLGHRAPCTPLGGRLWFGIVVLGLGILWTLDNLGFIDSDRILEWWPVVLIVFGLSKLFAREGARPLAAAVWIGIGAWLLAHNLGIVSKGMGELWPVLLIVLGLSIVRRALAGRSTTDPSPTAALAVEGDAAAPPVAPGTDTFSCTAIWAGVDRKITSHAFRGGDYTAIMGGGNVNLRDARPVPGGAVVEVFVVMGGIDIIVPEDWHVVNQIHVLMGAVEERRHAAPPEVGHVLYLRGTVIMGGVEVKN